MAKCRTNLICLHNVAIARSNLKTITVSLSVGLIAAVRSYLHHGLVSTQGQQHAGAQLVLGQGEQELLGLVAGAHQDVNLE